MKSIFKQIWTSPAESERIAFVALAFDFVLIKKKRFGGEVFRASLHRREDINKEAKLPTHIFLLLGYVLHDPYKVKRIKNMCAFNISVAVFNLHLFFSLNVAQAFVCWTYLSRVKIWAILIIPRILNWVTLEHVQKSDQHRYSKNSRENRKLHSIVITKREMLGDESHQREIHKHIHTSLRITYPNSTIDISISFCFQPSSRVATVFIVSTLWRKLSWTELFVSKFLSSSSSSSLCLS